MQALEQPLTYHKLDDIHIPSAHRTLVVIYEAKNEERIVRFITSLNTSETIKVDIITIGKDGSLYFGYHQNEKNLPVQIDKVKETLKKLSPYIENYEQVIEVNRWNTLLSQKDSSSPAPADGKEQS